MTGKYVVVLTGIIMSLICFNHFAIGYLNEFIELNGCKQRRVKEPKIISPFIRHEDRKSQDIRQSFGTVSEIKYDGTVYISILIHSIITIVLCLVLTVVVTVVFFVLDYLMWWAFLIAIGYNVTIGLIYFYYWLKFRKEKKK